MHRKSRIFSLLIACLALCAAALTGCGHDGADSVAPTQEVSSPAPGSVIAVGVTNMT